MATSGDVQNMLFCIIYKYVLAFNGSLVFLLFDLTLNEFTNIS